MFYTLTANPAVDMTVAGPTLVPDENVRANSASYTANGKGLDVSFALKKFGVDSVALGFFGGFTGKFIVEETYLRLHQRWRARVRRPQSGCPAYPSV